MPSVHVSIARDRASLRDTPPTPTRRLGVGLLALCLALCVAGSAAAVEDSPARKLGRGFGNLTLGILQIPAEVIDTTKENGPAVGVTWGLIKGTGMMVATTAVGLFEVLSCPFATPPDYRPILSPEFPWQLFTGDPREGELKRRRRAGSDPSDGRRVR